MHESSRRRVGAVHALLNSIEPTQAAFDQRWPDADVAHLLDGSLYLDRSRGTADERELSSRIERLIRYSADTGAEAILFTGSFFATAVRQARTAVDIPVLTSFDGLIDRALDLRRPLHVLSTAPDTMPLLVAELQGAAGERSMRVRVSGQVVEGAMDALLNRDSVRHDRLITDAVRAADPDAAVVFAQFSMERALEASAAVTAAPVIGPAGEGVAWLRRVLGIPSC